VHSEPARTRLEGSPAVESTLSSVEHARARQWRLSEEEWTRYRSLMQGIRGSISPASISPIEVLGIHARDDAERRRYAEAWGKVMREDVDREPSSLRQFRECADPPASDGIRTTDHGRY